MKIKVLFLLLILFQLLNAQNLTLEEAITKTIEHHPDVKQFMLRIQQAKKGYNIAKADKRPQVNFTATYNPTQTYTLPMNGSFNTVDDNGWSIGITLRKKIWDFEKTSSLIDASKIDEDISKLSLDEVKTLLAYKVKSLYKLLIVQRDAIKAREKDFETKEAFYSQAEALVKQGLKTKADSYRFRSSLYVAKESLVTAKATFDKAKISLSLYTGISISDNVILENNILSNSELIDNDIRKEVLLTNSKIKKDKLTIEKSKLLHKSAKKGKYGSIDVVSSYSRIDTLNSYNSHYIGVSYSVPIYSGGKIKAQEQQAQIGYQIAKEQQSSDILALKEELDTLLIDIKRYDATIEAREAQLISSKSTQRVIEARYKEGLATYIEVLDNITLVLNAKLALLQAYYSKSLAYDRVEYLKGKL